MCRGWVCIAYRGAWSENPPDYQPAGVMRGAAADSTQRRPFLVVCHAPTAAYVTAATSIVIISPLPDLTRATKQKRNQL